MIRRRTAVGIALLSSGAAAFGVGMATNGNTAPKPAIPAVCAEATNQSPVLTESQANDYMKAVGDCILGLNKIAPPADQVASGGYEVETSFFTKTGDIATLELIDWPPAGGVSASSWQILEQLLSSTKGNPLPYDISGKFYATPGSTLPPEWHGSLLTNDMHNGVELNGLNDVSSNGKLTTDTENWHKLQTATNTLLGLAETAIMHDLSPTAPATAASSGMPV